MVRMKRSAITADATASSPRAEISATPALRELATAFWWCDAFIISTAVALRRLRNRRRRPDLRLRARHLPARRRFLDLHCHRHREVRLFHRPRAYGTGGLHHPYQSARRN